jgi:hypothetical protein
MLICMRTTLVLDDGLLRQAKRRAAERNTTVSQVVNEALRESFRRPIDKAPPFSMVTYGDAGKRKRLEPAEMSALLDEQEIESLR